MFEIVGNLHLHTTTSDGTGTHAEVAAAAARAGLDFIIYTDHNCTVEGMEGWYHHPETGRELLRLMGQEIHDKRFAPSHSHLLCYFVPDDLQSVVADPQRLIDVIRERGGLSFLAHPFERLGYPDTEDGRNTFDWRHWHVTGYHGIELWNAMSEVKWQLRTLFRILVGAYFPPLVLTAPFPEVAAKWDELLNAGQKVVAIGGSDAHAIAYRRYGFFNRVIYPYEFLFRAVNTHLLLSDPLSREVTTARGQIFDALRWGHCFVSYDLPASPRGFTFTAAADDRQVIMGDALPAEGTVHLQATSPHPARLRLIKNGRPIAETTGRELDWHTSEPGVYRVEAYRRYWGRQRAWVFTNPIYIEA